MTNLPRLVEVRTRILKENDVIARDLRQRFHDDGVFVVSLVSSPGAGKTLFLERTLMRLRESYRVAALVGDLATENDARRLARAEVPVKQISTGTMCHLEAAMIRGALADWRTSELDFLFVENVGNLVCPASYDLGEDMRLVLFSVTEGEDKPLKYPIIFNTADVAVISKMDLAEIVEFDLSAARENIHAVRPGMDILEVSAKSGLGMGTWIERVEHQRDQAPRAFLKTRECLIGHMELLGMELSRLIQALSDPVAYPYPVDAVEVRQTHISVVFLAGPWAFKIKKPVRPGFLDFSTSEKRLHFCEEEVRLNRRLAPQVYLGVVPVTRNNLKVQFEGEGEVVEWAVKMQRLPQAATLQELLQNGDVGVELVQSLAQRIASFHRCAEANERIGAFGRVEPVAKIILDIYEQALPQVGTTVSPSVHDRTKKLAEEGLRHFGSLIDERAVRGMTRDCHGDLHLDHVYFFPNQIPPDDLVIIDCIEFNERFRFIDPVADMAFPVMDFAYYGRRDLGRAFADAYFSASGDEEGRALLPLYTAHRATVRGTVEGLLLAEKEVPPAEREAALRKAQAHWLLALTELEKPERKPCVVLVAGLPGSGKSRLAEGLARRGNFEVIRSDVVRKELAGMSSQGQTPPQLRESLYTLDWNDRTYLECLRRADELLLEGMRVIVDATFRQEKHRRSFFEAAIQRGVPGFILLCNAEPETVRRRLQARQGDASDADWSVYLQHTASWEEIGEASRRLVHTVSTEGGPQLAIDRALEELRQVGLQR